MDAVHRLLQSWERRRPAREFRRWSEQGAAASRRRANPLDLVPPTLVRRFGFSRRRPPTLTLVCLLSCAICGLLMPTFAPAEPFLPNDGAQVLERLRATALDPAARELRELRAQLGTDPRNLRLAAQFARRCIERSRSEADPRYLGRAQAVLAPWWNVPAAPPEALVLRATVRQSQHDFTNALADLELALNQSPHNPQAWLTRATILTILGDYPAARRACLPLAQLAPGLVALTAAASVACLDGEADRGCSLLRNALEAFPAAPSEKIWALTVLGEASARLGHEADAENFFKRALELDHRDPYLQGCYADLLLDQGRASEAAALLKDDARADGLVLRLALAESKLEPIPASLQIHVNTLRARFQAGHLRGDFVHQREEARFTLDLLGAPREALCLAQDNWRVQREPADVRILLECALAAHDHAAAQPALDFIRRTHIQDAGWQSWSKNLTPYPPDKYDKARAYAWPWAATDFQCDSRCVPVRLPAGGRAHFEQRLSDAAPRKGKSPRRVASGTARPGGCGRAGQQ
jgi:Tfp pilus assembly protein PilF